VVSLNDVVAKFLPARNCCNSLPRSARSNSSQRPPVSVPPPRQIDLHWSRSRSCQIRRRRERGAAVVAAAMFEYGPCCSRVIARTRSCRCSNLADRGVLYDVAAKSYLREVARRVPQLTPVQRSIKYWLIFRRSPSRHSRTDYLHRPEGARQFVGASGCAVVVAWPCWNRGRDCWLRPWRYAVAVAGRPVSRIVKRVAAK